MLSILKEKIAFKTAFQYPFNKPIRMLNFLWIFLPIIGWFALGGYNIRIVKEFSSGKFKKLPEFKFSENLKLGFFMFIKFIPLLLVIIPIIYIPHLVNETVGTVFELLFSFFIIPILVINFYNKETVSSLFELKIIKHVFYNLGDYTMALIKGILLSIIFFLGWIILVGIPAGSFTKNIYMSDFYRRKVK